MRSARVVPGSAGLFSHLLYQVGRMGWLILKKLCLSLKLKTLPYTCNVLFPVPAFQWPPTSHGDAACGLGGEGTPHARPLRLALRLPARRKEPYLARFLPLLATLPACLLLPSSPHPSLPRRGPGHLTFSLSGPTCHSPAGSAVEPGVGHEPGSAAGSALLRLAPPGLWGKAAAGTCAPLSEGRRKAAGQPGDPATACWGGRWAEVGPTGMQVGGTAGWRCRGRSRTRCRRQGKGVLGGPARGWVTSVLGKRSGSLLYRLRPEALGNYLVSVGGSAPLCRAGSGRRRVPEPWDPGSGPEKAQGRGEKGHAKVAEVNWC